MSYRDVVPISTRIVVAVAGAKGTDPLSLSPPLADELDVDALDALCASGGDLVVSLHAWGYRITVQNGRVTALSTSTMPSASAD